MTHHVIVGGGPAATNAIETIRQFEANRSTITIVSDEPAHSRMALPYWLAGKIPEQHTHTGDADYFRNLDVDTRFGIRADSLNVDQNQVTLSDGQVITYDNVLIATGSSPVSSPISGADLPGVQPLWTLADTQRVLDATAGIQDPRIVLVGAGFIGFIVLNAMFKRRWKLTVVEREGQVLPRMLDRSAATLVQSWLAKENVAVHVGTSVQEIHPNPDGGKRVELESGQSIDADIVIMATGIKANLELAISAGIDTNEGILVNDRMQTNRAKVYAAGDVAEGPVQYSDKPAIHAIQPTAVDHGRIAGANMAGHEIRYLGSLLMNVVDVCGLQNASFGNWSDSSAEATVISNESNFIYRKLIWNDDKLIGAIFTGRANDLGMLNDVGMVKGILQTETRLGTWKQYLAENPFDVRRAYIGSGVAAKLVKTTLTGQPSRPRQFRYGNAKVQTDVTAAHGIYMATKQS